MLNNVLQACVLFNIKWAPEQNYESSDVTVFAVGTREMKKKHVGLLGYLLLLYRCCQIQYCQPFLYVIILNNLSVMHFCYSQSRRERALSRGATARTTRKPLLNE